MFSANTAASLGGKRELQSAETSQRRNAASFAVPSTPLSRPESATPASASTPSTTTRPYKTRERLYYDTDYVKNASTGARPAASAATAAFEPFLRRAGAEDAPVAPSEELPPTASLHELLFSPGSGTDGKEPAARREQTAPGGILGSPIKSTGLAGGLVSEAGSQWSSVLIGGGETQLTRSVTVFGFPPACRVDVLGAFQALGTIERYDPGDGNWLHIVYDSEWAAQRALARNGSVFNPGGMMIGVVPMQAAIEQVNAAAESFMSPLRSGPVAPDATRPASQSIFRASQPATSAITVSSLPGDTSLMTKAVKYMFGW